jgi:hypothetical protein
MRHIFKDSEEVAKKNNAWQLNQNNDYKPTAKKESEAKQTKNKVARYTHCKKCNKELTSYRSRFWGICGYCDRI